MINETVILKLILIGNAGVGKTSIINQFCWNQFDERSQATISANFFTQIIENMQGKNIKLQIWDTVGHEKYKSLTKQYLRSATACIIVCEYDKINNKNQFNQCINWHQELLNAWSSDSQIPIYLVQNKYDLIQEEDKEQAAQDLNEFCQKNNFKHYLQVSAKTKYNVDALFEKFTEIILQCQEKEIDQQNKQKVSTQSIDMFIKKEKNSEKCC